MADDLANRIIAKEYRCLLLTAEVMVILLSPVRTLHVILGAVYNRSLQEVNPPSLCVFRRDFETPDD